MIEEDGSFSLSSQCLLSPFNSGETEAQKGQVQVACPEPPAGKGERWAQDQSSDYKSYHIRAVKAALTLLFHNFQLLTFLEGAIDQIIK